jgi:thiamine monophosphate synthase
MADCSYFREKAEQCRRLARDSTDPVLIEGLTDLALEYFAQAVAIEAKALGKDPDNE